MTPYWYTYPRGSGSSARTVITIPLNYDKGMTCVPLLPTSLLRLKTEVAALKAEVAFLKGEQGEDTTLTEDEDAGLCAAVKLWVTAADESTPLDIGAFTVWD